MLICHVKIYFLSHKYHFSEEHLNAKKSCPNTLHPSKKTKIENNLSMWQSFSTSTWSYLLMEGAARVYAVESVVMAHAMP